MIFKNIAIDAIVYERLAELKRKFAYVAGRSFSFGQVINKLINFYEACEGSEIDFDLEKDNTVAQQELEDVEGLSHLDEEASQDDL